MDYFKHEGYAKAAEKFAAEANIRSDRGSINERVDIQDALHAGDAEVAISKINELNPQILDDDKPLHFALLRLQLVELIRSCLKNPNDDITPALDFATKHLAPRASTNDDFREDLEKTMALLIFPPDNLAPELKDLLDPRLRTDVADRVNKAILSSQGERPEAMIRALVRLRNWAEVKARKEKKNLPVKIGLALEPELTSYRNGIEDSIMQGNGAIDPMIS
ncbi:MAG: hypothetical protein M1834_005281 [Cirrosporium novae-zelandiae]|nr:MAG: hypothetical protein M1834_005281 [Cirrosporium novae-zelandiae]